MLKEKGLEELSGADGLTVIIPGSDLDLRNKIKSREQGWQI